MFLALAIAVAFILTLWLIQRGADPLWTWLASSMLGPMSVLLPEQLSAGGNEGVRLVTLLLPALWTALAGGAGAVIGAKLRKPRTPD